PWMGADGSFSTPARTELAAGARWRPAATSTRRGGTTRGFVQAGPRAASSPPVRTVSVPPAATCPPREGGVLAPAPEGAEPPRTSRQRGRTTHGRSRQEACIPEEAVRSRALRCEEPRARRQGPRAHRVVRPHDAGGAPDPRALREAEAAQGNADGGVPARHRGDRESRGRAEGRRG